MARFLFTVWPFPGHVHPNVAIARALVARGHDPAFYTGRSIAPSLENEGLLVFPFQAVDEHRVTDTVRSLDALSLDWRRARERKAMLRDWLLETIDAQLQDLDRIVKEWKPDVLVCDPAMWGPLIVLHDREALPLAVMSYVAACMLPGPEGPILGVPLRKATGPLSRMGRRALRLVERVVSADVRRGADDIRARHGLAPMHTSVTAYGGRMPLYIVPTSRLYDRQRADLPPSVQYVGPCHWDKPVGNPPPGWLTEMPRDQPLVYVTEGTMHSKPAFVLRTALQALADLPVRVVATTGTHRDPELLDLHPAPANARIERFVPHSQLFPRTSLVVTTGGTGTVLAALAAGIPLVIVPTAWDQPENAWRVVEAGAGVRVPPGQCTPATLRAAVQRVLSDASFASNARRLGDDFSRYGGAPRAADLLENLVKTNEEAPRAVDATFTASAARR
jgi:MGT family glycosyltransferase